MVTALSTTGTNIGLMSEEWWVGRGILLGLSTVLQKIPVTVMNILFHIEVMAQKREETSGRRWVPRWYPVVPWVFWGMSVTGSFAITIILTSKGLLGTTDIGETGVPCKI